MGLLDVKEKIKKTAQSVNDIAANIKENGVTETTKNVLKDMTNIDKKTSDTKQKNIKINTNKKPKSELTKDDLFELEYYINSAAYFQNAIDKYVEKVMPINNRYITEEFSEKYMVVWKHDQFKTKNVEFEKDPNNKDDPNAIKIKVYSNIFEPVTIGFIPKENNIAFRQLMDRNKIYNVNLTIYGGEKKVISKNNVYHDKDNYRVILRVIFKK